MRPSALICALVAVHVAAAFELASDDLGKKAYQMADVDGLSLEEELREKGKPESVEKLLEATKVVEGAEGCSWSRFQELIELLRTEKSYPSPLLIKKALANQFNACGNKATDLPADDGLTPEERNSLAQFSKRMKPENYDNQKLMAMNVLAYLKEDRSLTFKHIKKNDNERIAFGGIFYKEMDFCFKIDNKLRPYYVFADQLSEPWTYSSTFGTTMPQVVERIQMGLICRAFVDGNKKIEEIAFKKTMGKWYNFKKAFKEITSEDDD